MLENIDSLINTYDDKCYSLYQIADELHQFSDMSYNDFVEYCRNKIIEKYSKIRESKEDQEVVEYFSNLPHYGHVDSEGDFVYPKELICGKKITL